MKAFMPWLAVVLLWPVGLVAQTPDFDFILSDSTIDYDVATGVGGGEVRMSFRENDTTPGFPHTVQGWAVSVSVDPILLDVQAIEQGEYIQSLNGGSGPDFWQATIETEGITVGTVYGFLGMTGCTYEVERETAVYQLTTNTNTLAGDADGETSIVSFGPPIGSPPVETVVVVSGASLPTQTIDAVVDLNPIPSGPVFLRGDVNANGVVEPLADSVSLLSLAFAGGGADVFPCLDSADVDDNGLVQINDPVYLLQFGFSFGAPPPAPQDVCGVDPTDDFIDCAMGCP